MMDKDCSGQTANAVAGQVHRRVRPHSEALKPCPFCGRATTLKITSGAEFAGEDDEDVYGAWPHSDSFAVFCDAHQPSGPGGCGASGGFKPTEFEAVTAWNNRAPLPNLKFAGWFSEMPSGMSYRLWEQGGHECDAGENEVALYEA